MSNNSPYISILYFASLGERLAADEEQYTLATPCTVSTLIDTLAGRGENWREALSAPSVKCAINHTLCKRDTIINPGDEVAFFPPVTGG